MVQSYEKPNKNGFSLIELIVVLSGLGILSSLAIPNVLKYLDYARVDEAKSLLNNAAADCLQGLRREGSGRLTQEVDPSIISDDRLESTGYKFQDISTTKNCGNTLITAISESDQERMPTLGFTITSEGKLTKLAVDTGSDTAFAAKSWAGINVTEAAGLKELMDYNQAILDAKAACIETFKSWLTNTGDGKSFTWDETANSGCPTKPPKAVSTTCTTNGCTKPVYALDNNIVGNTEEAYDAAFKAKYDELCSQEVVNKRNKSATTNSTDGEKLPNCGNKLFWFFEGENAGSSDAWESLMCNKNKQKLLSTTHSGTVEYCGASPIYICGGEEITGSNAKANFEECLASDKNAICTSALNNDAVKRTNAGPHTSPTPGDMSKPIGEDCNIQYWYCKKSGKIYRTKEDYNADETCKIRNCGSAPSKNCNKPKFFADPFCYAYSDCMGRL